VIRTIIYSIVKSDIETMVRKPEGVIIANESAKDHRRFRQGIYGPRERDLLRPSLDGNNVQ
jgi:hypothetical protein